MQKNPNQLIWVFRIKISKKGDYPKATRLKPVISTPNSLT